MSEFFDEFFDVQDFIDSISVDGNVDSIFEWRKQWAPEDPKFLLCFSRVRKMCGNTIVFQHGDSMLAFEHVKRITVKLLDKTGKMLAKIYYPPRSVADGGGTSCCSVILKNQKI